MKKVLAALLAVMMLFGALSVGASAASNYDQYFGGESPIADKATQTVLSFDLNGGALQNGAYIYDTASGQKVWMDGGKISGVYMMLPWSDNELKPGYLITLPYVTAPDGYMCTGWYCYDDGYTYAMGSSWTIPADAAGRIVEFRAAYAPASLEEDTLTTVLNILIKVFGAIIGIVLYSGNTQAGVAMMEKVLGGIL